MNKNNPKEADPKILEESERNRYFAALDKVIEGKAHELDEINKSIAPKVLLLLHLLAVDPVWIAASNCSPNQVFFTPALGVAVGLDYEDVTLALNVLIKKGVIKISEVRPQGCLVITFHR